MLGNLRHSIWLCLVALAAAVSAPQAAQASYFVALHTYQQSPDGSATADYNNGRTGSFFQPAGSSTATGTVDATGTAKSAFDQVSGVGSAEGLTSNSSTAADLRTGKVHVNIFNNADCNGACKNDVPCACGGAIPDFAGERGFAELNDTLHFIIPGATANTVTQVGVVFAVDGTLVQTSPFGNGFLRSQLGFGSARSTYWQDLNNGTGNVVAFGTPFVFGWDHSQFLTLTSSRAVFEGTYDLVGPNPTVVADLFMDVGCFDGMTCNFAHTGSIDLVLPGGVRFTSDSGVFLAPATVPEPGTLLLLGPAFMSLAGLRRKRLIA